MVVSPPPFPGAVQLHASRIEKGGELLYRQVFKSPGPLEDQLRHYRETLAEGGWRERPKGPAEGPSVRDLENCLTFEREGAVCDVVIQGRPETGEVYTTVLVREIGGVKRADTGRLGPVKK